MAIKKSPSRNKKSSTRKNSRSGPGKLRGVEFQASLIQAIHEASPDGILVVDSEGKVASVNQRFLDVWQIPNDRVPGGQASAVVGTPDRPILEMATERVKDPKGFVRRVKELYADPDQDDHCELELKDGRTLERHSTVLRGKNGRYQGRVWFFRDITTHKRTEATLRDLASHDSLTGAANRRNFFERAAEEYARARRYDRPVSIVVLDIDRFKQINDRYGHARGDEVLKTLTDGCKTQLREVDLFARIGGEEFAVLLPDTDLGNARMVAERLREFAAAQKVVTEGAEIHWTVSAGVATQSVADASIEECLKRADNALYLAKEGGRNRVEADTTTA
jgi:diguanylate cyclase (GGDEF)-like protein/PAS domain S-box-containing protein